MNKRDLKADLDWLNSLANSKERECCPDTIHETAVLSTERAIKAEALNRELVEALATAIDIAYTPDEDFIRDETFELIRCARVLDKAKEALNDES